MGFLHEVIPSLLSVGTHHTPHSHLHQSICHFSSQPSVQTHHHAWLCTAVHNKETCRPPRPCPSSGCRSTVCRVLTDRCSMSKRKTSYVPPSSTPSPRTLPTHGNEGYHPCVAPCYQRDSRPLRPCSDETSSSCVKTTVTPC